MCNRCSWTSCYSDVQFFEEMLIKVVKDFSIDTKKVYVTGNSNGSMFMHLIAKYFGN